MLQIEQPVAVQIQLRRPSDGAVSESRAFEFLPLDPGRAYWSAKRLKTNYSVFSQILTRDQQQQQQQPQQQQQQQQQELKHKVPLSRAPVMAGVFATPGAGADTEPSGDTDTPESQESFLLSSEEPAFSSVSTLSFLLVTGGDFSVLKV